jgi:hypothetical protein
MPGRLLATLAAAGAAIAVAVVLLAGSHGRVNVGSLDPVAQAADTTAQAGSASFGIAGSISAVGQNIPINGSGAIDMRNQRMRMSVSTALPGLGTAQIEEILDGTTFYMRLPAQVAGRIPGGKPWMKVDLAAVAKRAGIDLKQELGANQNNPADMLQALKAAGSSRVVGHENLRGAPTTHYSATIDLNRIATRIANRTTVDSLEQLYKRAGISSLPIDVWIDRAGRVRQESLRVSASNFSMDMTITLTAFGVPVDAASPPADQVMDASALLGSSIG